ncbi:Fba1 [Desulforapulum autotrophicum HRM2]|uniref:Fructose-bisphosphate aldolase n=1 Tax=Desulforapulum autotrophicum (strain ATCC 43914 / DSM 3382 / VKM B-1955 / HRM2) TaxID=177437 RepID=C0QJM3_DESAH|nr:class I fructose-bisphosphate aldolase [Desulforapulum autotrophicum]ACN13876.1 Fba1 [Desulforapulum autotrophicum HRM2]
MIHHSIMDDGLRKELESTARAMVAKGKGILAADESNATIAKRFQTIGVESVEETRRFYRELLFTTPEAEAFISGVILFDETIRQSTSDNVPFTRILEEKGIIPGIKVDKGLTILPGTDNETVTQGLDGLDARLDEYRKLGARFAKWRAVITIGNHKPTPLAIDANAHILARYAAMCQRAGIVPIVEPEVLINGSHDIDRCERTIEATLKALFTALDHHGVLLEGIILKPSMVTSGDTCPDQAGVEAVAAATIRCFKRSVPAAVPGIVFLSGGQSFELATIHLNAMNAMGSFPWELSFSYGRALQETTLKAWAGQTENKSKAQKVFYHRAKCNGAARSGSYTEAMELEG